MSDVIRLADNEAKEFIKQIVNVPINPRAIESYKRGLKLLAEYEQRGYATIKTKHDRSRP